MSNDDPGEAPQQALIGGATRLYAMIGDPIAQVKSPRIFNPLFASAGRDAVLIPVHIRADRFEETMRGLLSLGNLDGLIVTIPFKARALALIDVAMPMADMVGAVNAIRRDADGRWSGDIFDGRGLVEGLLARNVALVGKSVMLLGAGGAGSAVAIALAEAGVSAITIFDIDGEKAENLQRRLSRHFPRCDARTGPVDIGGHQYLINATPCGMAPFHGLPTPVDDLTPDVTVIDIIMEPEVTELLAQAKSRGCRTFGGRVMIDGQAAAMMKFFGIPT